MSARCLPRVAPARLPRVTRGRVVTRDSDGDEPKLTWKGFLQLLAMGAGSPLSGELKEINLKDPKRTVVFELDANNFEDADGNPISQGKYRDAGYVAKGDKTPVANVILPVVLGGAAIAFVVWTLQQL